jgi:hypothetical protein
MSYQSELPPSTETGPAGTKKALSFFSQRGTSFINCAEAYLLTHGYSYDDLDDAWTDVKPSPRKELDFGYTFDNLIRDLEKHSLTEVATFVRRYVSDGYADRSHRDFLKDHNIPEEVIAFTPLPRAASSVPTRPERNPFERLHRMNLLTNYEATVRTLVEMEGKEWFEHQKTWGENSIDGALETSRGGGDYSSGIIYGFGGWHRYFIRSNGNVVYSSSHGRSGVEKARSLGFEIQ